MAGEKGSNLSDEILKEILHWQRLQGFKTLRELIPQLLDTQKKRNVYEATDGTTPRSEIIRTLGVGSATVTGWWKMWYAHGILIREGRRYKRIVSLKDLGIALDATDSADDSKHG